MSNNAIVCGTETCPTAKEMRRFVARSTFHVLAHRSIESRLYTLLASLALSLTLGFAQALVGPLPFTLICVVVTLTVLLVACAFTYPSPRRLADDFGVSRIGTCLPPETRYMV